MLTDGGRNPDGGHAGATPGRVVAAASPESNAVFRRSFCTLSLWSAAAVGLAGCSPTSPRPPAGPTNADGAEGVKPVPPPAELVGKWRLEMKEAKSAKTSVYHFLRDGRLEVDTRLETPDLRVTDLLRRSVIKVEGDKITIVDISRTGADGIETVIPAQRRRPRTFQTRVKGDELHWSEVDEKGVPSPKPQVLKRVGE
jgi:hypothetical protein